MLPTPRRLHSNIFQIIRKHNPLPLLIRPPRLPLLPLPTRLPPHNRLPSDSLGDLRLRRRYTHTIEHTRVLLVTRLSYILSQHLEIRILMEPQEKISFRASVLLEPGFANPETLGHFSGCVPAFCGGVAPDSVDLEEPAEWPDDCCEGVDYEGHRQEKSRYSRFLSGSHFGTCYLRDEFIADFGNGVCHTIGEDEDDLIHFCVVLS